VKAQRATFSAPSPLLLALEGRAWFELAGAAAFGACLLRRMPRGDGHPVLVLPGWLASDASTRVLRGALRSLGYRAHGWKLGRNRGPSPEIARALEHRLLALVDASGRPLTLVGWSLGGIYASALAERYPEAVRGLVTLASPLRLAVAEQVTRSFGNGPARERGQNRVLPRTAVYSRSDGIVPWRACLAEPGPSSESLAVPSSHCGMGHHPATLWIVGHHLAEPRGRWRGLDVSGLLPRALGVTREEDAGEVRTRRARPTRPARRAAHAG
jgi:pimeloyl-ACP methyl ester carboxylesterase